MSTEDRNDGAEPLDRATLDSLRELGGGDEFLAELAALFLGDAPAHVNDIANAVAAGDAKAIASSSHALKSPAANMGAKRLQNLLAALEQAGRSGVLDDAAALLGEIQAEFARVARAMEALRLS